jgi:hypothetical protein
MFEIIRIYLAHHTALPGNGFGMSAFGAKRSLS